MGRVYKYQDLTQMDDLSRMKKNHKVLNNR
jgi:hypothetical protein